MGRLLRRSSLTLEPIGAHRGSYRQMKRYLKYSLLVVLALVALLLWKTGGAAGTTTRLTSAQAHELVAQGARLVDVRTPAEYDARHLPGAQNLPLQQLPEDMGKLEPKDQAIVLYCRSGHRSGLAADILKQAGFTKVHDLGPITAW
jgi:phage shock protein E